MLTSNITYLKNNFPDIYEKINTGTENNDYMSIFLEDTRDGNKTLKVVNKDGESIYLHSKYNPIREAQTILDSFKEREIVDKDSHVLFVGLGLGYHIEMFTKEYPDIDFSFYEPSAKLFSHFLKYQNLEEFAKDKLKYIQCESDNIDKFINKLIEKTFKRIIILELPIYEKILQEEYKDFLTRFKERVKYARTSIHTNLAFQKRWIINSMKNLNEVLYTPNILLEKKGGFKGKTAILVAAGPSLNEEIENLRYIKENGLAYIFSVGSAINTLIYHNVYPDVATTYDPTEINQKVFEMAKEMGIKDIPMIFGTSVGYETLEDYQGEKYHMITSQDSVSNYFLKSKDQESIGLVQDAPTIAVVTLQLLYELGFDTIILVGQNLAYRGNIQHSDAISYTENLTVEELSNAIKVKDVYGNDILTDDGYNRMRQQMEMYINTFQGIKVINTTKGGAHIDGTEFVNLKHIIDNDLKDKIVDKDWLSGDKTKYDSEYLKQQLRRIDRAYKNSLEINKEYNKILNRIEKSINNKNFTQIESLYIKLDKQLRKLEKNDFNIIFVLPMNRVQYKLLVDKIDALNEIKDPYEKGRQIIDSFRGFINICEGDIVLIQDAFEKMKEVIEKYIDDDIKEGELS